MSEKESGSCFSLGYFQYAKQTEGIPAGLAAPCLPGVSIGSEQYPSHHSGCPGSQCVPLPIPCCPTVSGKYTKYTSNDGDRVCPFLMSTNIYTAQGWLFCFIQCSSPEIIVLNCVTKMLEYNQQGRYYYINGKVVYQVERLCADLIITKV